MKLRKLEKILSMMRKNFFRLESIQNEGTDPADQSNADNSEDGDDDDSYNFGESDREDVIHKRKSEEEKRKNSNNKYDHPDNKPMGEIHLVRMNEEFLEEQVRVLLNSESDLEKLDIFLSRKQKTIKPTNQNLLVETEEDAKNFVEKLEREIKID